MGVMQAAIEPGNSIRMESKGLDSRGKGWSGIESNIIESNGVEWNGMESK
jgi:hypothetical protein